LAQRAKKRCSFQGCTALVDSGRCPAHTPDSDKRKHEIYGRDWRKLRDHKLKVDPICEIRTHCQGAIATQVDHIVRVSERPDLRLEWRNLQSACEDCHVAKTYFERTGKVMPQGGAHERSYI